MCVCVFVCVCVCVCARDAVLSGMVAMGLGLVGWLLWPYA